MVAMIAPAQENPMEGLCFNPDKPAEFPGGKVAMGQYFSENLEYPTDALIEGIEGRVMCQFIIQPDSSRTNINIVRKVHPSIDAEMRRLVENMPQWTPATKDGIPVKTLVTLPLMFKLPENLRIVTENVSVFYHDNNRYISCIRKGRSDNKFDINTKKEKITIDSVQKYITDNISQTYKHLDSTMLCMFTLNPDSTIKKIELYPYKNISEYIPENFKSYNEINIDSTYITLKNINKKTGLGYALKLNGFTKNDIYSPILNSNVENNIALTDSEEIINLKNDLKKLPKHLFSSIIHNTQIYQEGDSIIKPEVIYYTPIVCKDIDKLISLPLSIEDQVILSMKPTYRGEGRDLSDFVIDKYNNTAWHLAGKTGALKIKFIVHKDGTLSSFETLEATNDAFPKGIVSFIKETEKKWTPGIYKNQYVDCEYIFDISLIERGGYTRQQLNQNDFIVKVNDLDYELDIYAHTAIAIGKNYNKSEITIPATITRNNINYKVTAITGFNNKTRLKKVVIEDGIVSIKAETFSGCTSLESIIIPNSVTTIESLAFEKCTSLKYISLPNNIKTIWGGTFHMCTSLKAITIPKNITKIEEYAFKDCPALKNITIPKNVEFIANNAFENCISLDSIIIHDSLYIDANAFINTAWYNKQPNGCVYLNNILLNYKGDKSKITHIDIKDGVTILVDNIFAEYKVLTSVVIPESVKVIGNNAFKGCSKLTNVAIPNSIESIGNNAFQNCFLLKNITISEKIKTIGNNAFENCTSLEKIVIPKNIRKIGIEALKGCTSLKEVKILSDNITRIQPETFCNCHSMESIILPESVTTIGSGVFKNCKSITKITIPAKVTEIGYHTFNGCSSLKTIEFKSIIPPKMQSSKFETEVQLIIPAGSEAAYQEAFNSK